MLCILRRLKCKLIYMFKYSCYLINNWVKLAPELIYIKIVGSPTQSTRGKSLKHCFPLVQQEHLQRNVKVISFNKIFIIFYIKKTIYSIALTKLL